MHATSLSRPQVGRHARPFSSRPPRRSLVVVRSGEDIRGGKMEKGMFGENFGARDPFAGELATNFGENVLGNYNTEHIIKPPDTIRKVLGLSARRCQDNAATLALLSDEQRELLRQQVPGWRVASAGTDKAVTCIQQSWRLKDEEAAAEAAARFGGVAAAEGHADSLRVARVGSEVVAELWTASLGGLTENDFIVASKINDINLADLLPKRKQRFWA